MVIASKTDSEILKELGGRLRSYRLQMNLTQAELATRAGVSRTTIRDAELGKDSQLPTLVKFLRALGRLDNLGKLMLDQINGDVVCKVIEYEQAKGNMPAIVNRYLAVAYGTRYARCCFTYPRPADSLRAYQQRVGDRVQEGREPKRRRKKKPLET